MAPMYFKGYTDTETFIIWLKEYLLPELKQNQVIIMDNASFHKSKEIKELIESKNCKLIYQPPYSPDLNPIEHYWHFLKDLIRKFRLNCDNFYENLDRALKERYVATKM